MSRGLEPWILKWWDIANGRRFKLILKKYKGGGISERQEKELTMLQEVCGAVMNYGSPKYIKVNEMAMGDYCPRCRTTHDILKGCPPIVEPGVPMTGSISRDLMDAQAEIRRLNIQIEELKKNWVQCHQQCGTAFHKAYCPFPGDPSERLCGCRGDQHERECDTFCSDHGTLKPCRHCLGNKGL